MVQQSKPLRANSFMTEYSPLPGTLRSNTREVTDEPCTKNNTGRGASPFFGAPTRLRNIHNGTSPFLAQYSRLQISPPSAFAAPADRAGSAPASIPATRPRPAPLMTARRARGFPDGVTVRGVMLFPSAFSLVFDRSIKFSSAPKHLEGSV